MTPEAVALSLALFPPFFAEPRETVEERRVRLRPLAVAIATVAKNPEDAAFLETQAYYESRLAKYVLEGRCSEGPPGMRCDPDRAGKPRARGPWQLWRVACKADDLAGQARCVLGTAHLGLAHCGSWAAAFGALTGHFQCVYMHDREQTMRRVLRQWSVK